MSLLLDWLDNECVFTNLLGDELVVLARKVTQFRHHFHHFVKISPHSFLSKLCQLLDLSSYKFEDGLCLENSLSLNGRNWEPVLIDAHFLNGSLVHGHIRDLFNHVLDRIGQLRLLDTVLEIKGCQVVLMLHVGVAYLRQLVLLPLGFERWQRVPLISRFCLENGPELFLCLLNVIKGCPLMHSFLANHAISGKHDVKLAVRVIDELNLVKDVITVGTVLEINLGHVDVPWLLRPTLVIVNSILLFFSKFLVNGHIVHLLFHLKDLFRPSLLSLFKEGSSIFSVIEVETGPVSHY